MFQDFKKTAVTPIPNAFHSDIEKMVNRVYLPISTHLFNQNGSFYMANNKQNISVGFVWLIKRAMPMELLMCVLVLSAKHPILESILSIAQHLKQLRGVPAMSTDIYITNIDRERIKEILDKMRERNQPLEESARKLEDELTRAIIVDSKQIPSDVITMNSQALLRLDDEDMEMLLVYPKDADLSAMKLSIFSPIGTAILGYKEGNTVEWEVPSGTSKIHIKKILYQPEAAGDYEL